MKNVMVVAIVCAAGLWVFWYKSETAKQERAERRERLQEERRESEQQVTDERIRRERLESAAKEDAVRLFLRYVEKEEDRLKESIEEAKLTCEAIAIDQQSLSDELVVIGRQNEGESAASRQRGEKRRDEVEYVKRLLRSPVLNRLAATYLGEDLSAMRAEFQNQIGTITGLRDNLTSRRAANQRAYEAAIGSVDDDVNKKSKLARDKNKETRDRIEGNMRVLESRVDGLRNKIKKLEAKVSKSAWDNRALERLRKELEVAELQLSHYRDVEGLSSVNSLQNEALLAETRARRTHDTALDARTRADAEALEEYAHEVGIYNAASRYEERSLDAIRMAMRQRQNLLAVQMSDARRKLAFLKESSTNIDFLNAKEVEEMRRKIAKRLSVQVVGEEESK